MTKCPGHGKILFRLSELANITVFFIFNKRRKYNWEKVFFIAEIQCQRFCSNLLKAALPVPLIFLSSYTANLPPTLPQSRHFPGLFLLKITVITCFSFTTLITLTPQVRRVSIQLFIFATVGNVPQWRMIEGSDGWRRMSENCCGE
jgi:hypothetical protein